MALIDMSTPTPEENTLKQIKGMCQAIANQLSAMIQQIKMGVFDNPFGLTPQQVLDLLGADAALLFLLGKDIEDMFSKIEHPIKLVPDNYTYVINQDGTVTLTLVE